jgi:hypothetical protein
MGERLFFQPEVIGGRCRPFAVAGLVVADVVVDKSLPFAVAGLVVADVVVNKSQPLVVTVLVVVDKQLTASCFICTYNLTYVCTCMRT